MCFSPFNKNICRAYVAGCLCLAGVWGLRAGEPIEVVPFKGAATIDTNFDQGLPSDSKNLESMFPHSAQSAGRPQQAGGIMPPPPQQRPQSATEREKELIDRRRNWVFMTPEDFAKSGSDKDVSPGSEKNDDGKPTTAMERYYQHLYDLDQASATNQLGNTKLDRDSWATNSSQWNSPRQGDPGFAGSPFNPTADSGFFQPAKADSFVNIFSSDRDPSLPSPEQVREQAEQKAHMDSFKELWDMTPAPASSISTPTPVVTAAPVSGFNTVQSAMQPALNALSPAPANNSSAPLIPRPSVTTMRNVGPPHASFAPPQNPF